MRYDPGSQQSPVEQLGNQQQSNNQPHSTHDHPNLSENNGSQPYSHRLVNPMLGPSSFDRFMVRDLCDLDIHPFG